MGYYNASYRYYSEDQQKLIIPLIKDFNDAIKAAADSTEAKYLPVDIHPDIWGYRAIARDF